MLDSPPTPPLAPIPVKRAWYKKKRILIPGVLLALAGFVNAINGNSAGSNPSPSAEGASANPNFMAPEKSSAPTVKNDIAKLNQPVRDGDFEFVVKGVTCGKTEVGNKYLSTKAQGQFCLASLTVKNIGEKAGSMFGDNQKALDASGREFSADTAAAMYLKDSQAVYKEINPGNTLLGTVIFDVPRGTKITHVELHDSAFSGGAKVRVE